MSRRVATWTVLPVAAAAEPLDGNAREAADQSGRSDLREIDFPGGEALAGPAALPAMAPVTAHVVAEVLGGHMSAP